MFVWQLLSNGKSRSFTDTFQSKSQPSLAIRLLLLGYKVETHI